MKLYGSIDNRINENKMFCDTIEVGTGVTEYYWSDCLAYEVVGVKDQKHVTIREYDHKKADDIPYHNNWILISNPEKPEINLTKRGKYWYSTKTVTREELETIEATGNKLALFDLLSGGFDADKIREKGKQTTYKRMNVSFGVAEYYYDYEF